MNNYKFRKSSTEDIEERLFQKMEGLYDVGEIDFTPPTEQLLDDKMLFVVNEIYRKMQSLECDWWTIVLGGEGSGKSTFATSYIYNYCLTAKKDFIQQARTNISFDEFDILRMISHMDLDLMYNFIWADEGANVFFNRESMSKARRFVIKFINSMRFLRYFVVVCSVELSQLDTIVRTHRVKSLIKIQEHGVYHYYNHDQIFRLLSLNKGKRDDQFNWKAVEPEFVGWFRFSPETKTIVDQLKKLYLARFQLEVKQEYRKQAIKKLEKGTGQYVDDKAFKEIEDKLGIRKSGQLSVV